MIHVQLEYLCWRIQFWMMCHRPIMPVRLRAWALNYYGDERYHVSRRQRDFWIKQNAIDPGDLRFKPLPWPFGESAQGPFIGPWEQIARWFRSHTGGRSHRCEFTDPKRGALYGHKEGAFMDRLFEQFLKNIETDAEQ